MSVIVSRALPDVCDGLKPVHRRILYAMHEGKCDYNRPYRKSARVVGDVMGKYHPHGDQSIYDALVRMAQDFSMRLPLLDGQGNFGSIDGDPPAAMRYTEIRMAQSAHAMLADIEEGTVDFQTNYDDSAQEPKVLPARLPNLLINGASGIAVGMATNVPPHNPSEVIAGALALLQNPRLTDEELLAIVPGPDFPTGALILDQTRAAQAILSGRGSVLMRARHALEETRQGRTSIVFTEIPYQVNKASVLEKLAHLARDKQIEGIQDLRDESDREGIRLVVELRRDAQPEIVLKQIFLYTPLQSSFGVNMLALHHGRPKMMGVRAMLQAFLDFREQVVVRRARHELAAARHRAHVLVGLALAVSHIDEVIQLIRKSKTPAEARAALLKRKWDAKTVENLIALIDDARHRILRGGIYMLSTEQAQAILDLRLQRLTALGRSEIDAEVKELEARIADLLDILRERKRVQKIVAGELKEIGKVFSNERRSKFEEAMEDVDEEDLIAEEDMAVTLSHVGYIKRVPLATYRAQKRGGRGRAAMTTREQDFVTHLYSANTHQPVLFFSSSGMVYRMKIWKLPLGTPQSRGKALVNLLPLAQDETIATLTLLPRDKALWRDQQLVFATSHGQVRRNDIAAFENINRNGKIAMKLEPGERLIGVGLCTDKTDVLLTTKLGQAIRFSAQAIRVFSSRASRGVRGIRLGKGDEVISMALLRHSDASAEERQSYLRTAPRQSARSADAKPPEGLPALTSARTKELAAEEEFILSISANGFGKRSSAYEYRISGRGGKGIAAMQRTAKTGNLVAAFPVLHTDQLMLVNNHGTLIRMAVKGIRIAGRSTQGVTLTRLDKGTHVAAVVRLAESDEAEGGEAEEGNGAENTGEGYTGEAVPQEGAADTREDTPSGPANGAG